MDKQDQEISDFVQQMLPLVQNPESMEQIVTDKARHVNKLCGPKIQKRVVSRFLG